MELQLNSTGTALEEIHDPLLSEIGVRLVVKRDDLIHPYISGNKWRKLKYNIKAFRESEKEYIVTLGGAYSNHIVATAAAGKEFGIKTIGIIRGEELNGDSNPALRFAKECGMELIFISRDQYRNLHNPDGLELFTNEKQETRNKELYLIPEGGFNELAVKGCEEIIDEINIPFDFICCACGTGATLSGIIRKLKPHQHAIGFSVLHGESFLEKEAGKYAGTRDNWSINFDYHLGGYAKTTAELIEFCKVFSNKNNITVEPIYTGKMFYGIYDLLKKDFFKPGSTVVAIHTGGTAFTSEGYLGAKTWQNW